MSLFVWKGTYKNQEVGIKILRMTEVAQEKDIKDFEKELEIMKIVRANNIVQFIGTFHNSQQSLDNNEFLIINMHYFFVLLLLLLFRCNSGTEILYCFGILSSW
jgi:serine/threonine protein kinase